MYKKLIEPNSQKFQIGHMYAKRLRKKLENEKNNNYFNFFK